MKQLDKLVEGNKTEAAITHALETLCGYLPATYKDECDALVDQYADQILKLLISELADPSTLSKELV